MWLWCRRPPVATSSWLPAVSFFPGWLLAGVHSAPSFPPVPCWLTSLIILYKAFGVLLIGILSFLGFYDIISTGLFLILLCLLVFFILFFPKVLCFLCPFNFLKQKSNTGSFHRVTPLFFLSQHITFYITIIPLFMSPSRTMQMIHVCILSHHPSWISYSHFRLGQILKLNIFICKVGVMVTLPSWGVVRSKLDP